ncbi:MAG TPA: glycosyltransferase, partial [Thermoplasmata archaeon]|nr:glycosyltransferase [Thermoplasmata archaeon]
MPNPKIVYVVPPETPLDGAIRAEIDALSSAHVEICPLLATPTDAPSVARECERTAEGRMAGRGSLSERLSLLPRALRWKALKALGVGACIADTALAAGATSIHSHVGAPSLHAGLFAARLAGLPLSVTVHTASAVRWRGSDSLGRVEHVFAVSRYTARRLEEADIDAKVVYPSPIASPSANPERRLDRDGSDPVVYIPHIPPEPRLVVDIVHRTSRAHFWIAGPSAAPLREMVSRTGCSRRVTFFGRIIPDEAPLLAASCDVLLMPELPPCTDLPFDVVLAMTAGRPVVAPARRGIPEVVREHTFREIGGQAIHGALAPLLEDPDLRERAGDRN